MPPGIPPTAIQGVEPNGEVYYVDQATGQYWIEQKTPDGAGTGQWNVSTPDNLIEKVQVALTQNASNRRAAAQGLASGAGGFGIVGDYMRAIGQGGAQGQSAMYALDQYVPISAGGGQTGMTPQSFTQWMGSQGQGGRGVTPFTQENYQEAFRRLGHQGVLPGTGFGMAGSTNAWQPGIGSAGGGGGFTGYDRGPGIGAGGESSFMPTDWASQDPTQRAQTMQNIYAAVGNQDPYGFLRGTDVRDATEMIMGAEGASGDVAAWNPIAQAKRQQIQNRVNAYMASNPQFTGYDLLVAYSAASPSGFGSGFGQQYAPSLSGQY